jgi:hypothetical protein
VAEMGRQLHRAAKASNDHTVPSVATLATYVRRWEKGVVGITERYRLHYCTALGIPPSDFPGQATPDAAGHAMGGAEFGPNGAIMTGPGAHSGPNPLYWPGEPSGYRETGTGHNAVNRTEQQRQADPPLGHLMVALAEESLDFGEWADTSNIGDATLENYATQVRQLADDYIYTAPYPLLLDVKRLRDRVFAKLQGHQRPDQTRDLYLIGSQVCGMLAWVSGDLGYKRAALTQAWTAWVCAEHAEHDGARAWVRATQSKLAYWDTRYVESARLAEDGLRYAASGSVPTLLASQMARALARAGQADDAGQALSRARTERESASGQDEIGGAFGLTNAQYHYMAGTTQLWRRAPSEAVSESTQAIELFQARQPTRPHYGPEALTRVDLADA